MVSIVRNEASDSEVVPSTIRFSNSIYIPIDNGRKLVYKAVNVIP